MKRYHWLLSVVVAASAACASMDTQQPAAPREAKDEKTTVTGSHIPTKTGTAGSVYSVNPQDAQDSLTRAGPNVQPAGGR